LQDVTTGNAKRENEKKKGGQGGVQGDKRERSKGAIRFQNLGGGWMLLNKESTQKREGKTNTVHGDLAEKFKKAVSSRKGKRENARGGKVRGGKNTGSNPEVKFLESIC